MIWDMWEAGTFEMQLEKKEEECRRVHIQAMNVNMEERNVHLALPLSLYICIDLATGTEGE